MSGGANDLRSGDFSQMQAVIDEATTAFAEARGTIGAYQRYTLEARENSLAVQRENLTAAHSQIVDAASIHVLKIANQNAALVLNLLG